MGDVENRTRMKPHLGMLKHYRNCIHHLSPALYIQQEQNLTPSKSNAEGVLCRGENDL